MRNANSSGKRAAKKAVVTRTTRKSRLPLFVILAVVLVAAGGAYYLTQTEARNSISNSAAPTAAIVDNTRVAYPVSLFEDGLARHYEYSADGINIRYFILKSADGVIRAAFDACDVCWPEGKGYQQEGDEMICRNCGRRFSSNKINEVKGGCNPAPLNRRVENDQLIINVADIIEGKRYFDFSGEQRS